MKYSFRNDYSEGCHPKILEALTKHNLNQEDGYSEDIYCNQAKQLIQEKCNQSDADVHFLTGGTQVNLTLIAHALRPYESVIANEMAHIATHEAGAIEATGHKINTISRADGKLGTDDIQAVLDAHYFEHMVAPKLVFISNSTEIGTVYSAEELNELYDFCKKNNLFLYIDGARLGAAITAKNSGLSLETISANCDAFYIGGTKNGFLLGEALVITNDKLKSHLRYQMKQRGALLAKGRIFGLQFQTMLENDLYNSLAKHTNEMAKMLSDGLRNLGFSFLIEPETNQIFPIFPVEIIKKIESDYGFYIWEAINSETACVRLVTSWQTKTSDIQTFLKDLSQIM
ncbi:MAG: aminotransferase class I/II-fold pyridoxal phosphate-dependent enzyme [Bacteroidales bacterium]|jgi:threonine aldolase|nr:aminotransferase class I/II-fold pyridoxal phosphate-dependent enzyme [Bacteroidales bacterium]